jgi:hypothetical protein
LQEDQGLPGRPFLPEQVHPFTVLHFFFFFFEIFFLTFRSFSAIGYFSDSSTGSAARELALSSQAAFALFGGMTADAFAALAEDARTYRVRVRILALMLNLAGANILTAVTQPMYDLGVFHYGGGMSVVTMDALPAAPAVVVATPAPATPAPASAPASARAVPAPVGAAQLLGGGTAQTPTGGANTDAAPGRRARPRATQTQTQMHG